MLRFVVMLGLVGLLGVLSGCATLNKAQCEAGDWRNLGVTDGANGRPLSYLSDHISACAEHNIPVNRALYEAGRTEGLRSYCRLDRAESEGRAGRTNYHVCEGSLGFSFDRIFAGARAVYEIDNELSSANAALDDLLRQIVLSGLTDAQRQELRLAIRHQRNRIDLLEDRRALAEQELRFLYKQEQRQFG